jgi:hypothetical protein
MKKLLLTLCAAMAAGTALATVPVLDQYLPALGHAFGASVNGVQPWWRGDVWVFNPSTTQTATVDIYLLLRQANPNPDSRRITVNPGETAHFQDVIGSGLFQLDNTFAGLRFVSTVPVVVTGESYDANVTVVNKGQGTAGQFFAGLPADYAIGPGESTDLPGFDQDGTGTSGTFRSNLAVVETTGSPVNYTLQLYNGSGTQVGTKSYSLQGREVGQINTVITDVTGTTGTNNRVHVVVTGGTGQLVAVGSRIDNRTGDPSTIDMVAFHRFGLIEGVVFDVTGQLVDGGLQLSISDSAITNYDVLTGIPCGTDEFTLDFGPKSGPATIGPDGTFSTSVTYDYTDPTTNATLFTTIWTLAGARAGDGTWSGTVRSDTSGGTGTYAPCNQTNVMRPWRASWTTGTQ